MKIINFGSLNIDRTYEVESFVKAGQTLASKKFQVFIGGKGLNQAIALARAGADVYHVGVIGKDGDSLRQALLDEGVNIKYLRQVSDVYSGHTVIQVDPQGENCILFEAGSNQLLSKDLIDQVFEDFKEERAMVLTQNEVSNVDYILQRAKEEGHLVVFNPSPMKAEVLDMPLESVDYFLINKVEGQVLTLKDESRDIFQAMQELYPKAAILLTLGERGSLFKDESTSYQQDAIKTRVVDTTAAGDTFTGYFLSGLMSKEDTSTVLKRASTASSIAISKKGAVVSIPRKTEVEEKLKENL